MVRDPTRPTRSATLFPYTARCRSGGAKLVHEGVPPVRPALFEQPGADLQLVRHWEVAAAPGAHDDEQRKELDRLFGEAVDCLLLVAGDRKSTRLNSSH